MLDDEIFILLEAQSTDQPNENYYKSSKLP